MKSLTIYGTEVNYSLADLGMSAEVITNGAVILNRNLMSEFLQEPLPCQNVAASGPKVMSKNHSTLQLSNFRTFAAAWLSLELGIMSW